MKILRRRYRGFLTVLLYASLASSAWLGCSNESGTVLGKVPRGEVKNIIAVRAGETAPQVTLRGVMIEKCPTAGCWFYLRDETDTIRVDTKAAGFVVVNVPLQTTLTVSGKVVQESDEMALQASGLRY